MKILLKIVQRSPVYPSARLPRYEHFTVLILSFLYRYIRIFKEVETSQDAFTHKRF